MSGSNGNLPLSLSLTDRRLPAGLTFRAETADILTGEYLMSEVSERRRKPRQKPVRNRRSIRVTIAERAGIDRRGTGQGPGYQRTSAWGWRPTARSNSMPSSSCKDTWGRTAPPAKYAPGWCGVTPIPSGGFRTGLAFETGPGQNGKAADAVPDYYEAAADQPKCRPGHDSSRVPFAGAALPSRQCSHRRREGVPGHHRRLYGVERTGKARRLRCQSARLPAGSLAHFRSAAGGHRQDGRKIQAAGDILDLLYTQALQRA